MCKGFTPAQGLMHLPRYFSISFLFAVSLLSQSIAVAQTRWTPPAQPATPPITERTYYLQNYFTGGISGGVSLLPSASNFFFSYAYPPPGGFPVSNDIEKLTFDGMGDGLNIQANAGIDIALTKKLKLIIRGNLDYSNVRNTEQQSYYYANETTNPSIVEKNYSLTLWHCYLRSYG